MQKKNKEAAEKQAIINEFLNQKFIVLNDYINDGHIDVGIEFIKDPYNFDQDDAGRMIDAKTKKDNKQEENSEESEDIENMATQRTNYSSRRMIDEQSSLKL